MITSQPVVAVGIDGSLEALVAARYAAQLATDLGVVLRLVHAYAAPPAGRTDRQRLRSAEIAAHFLVDDVARQLDLPPEMTVERVVQLRAVEALLSEQVAVVQVLVVGEKRREPGRSAALHGREPGVAAHSRAASAVLVGALGAVTVVPLHWMPRRPPSEFLRRS